MPLPPTEWTVEVRRLTCSMAGTRGDVLIVQTTPIIPLGEEQHPRDSAEVKGDKLGDSSDPTP